MIEDDSVKITFFGSQDKLRIHNSAVYGYYEVKKEIFMYRIPIIINKKESSIRKYVFASKVLSGTIDVFKKENVLTYYSFDGNTMSTYATKKETYIAKKSDVFQTIYSDYYSRNKKVNTVLTKLVSDDEYISNKLLGKKVQLPLDILNLIEEYNLKNYSTPSINSDRGNRNITFYRRSKKSKDELDVLIGDNKVEYIPHNSVLKIRFFPKTKNLICFRNSTQEKCLIFESNVYVDSYYQLSITNKGNVIVEQKNKKEALHDLKIINTLIKK